MDSCNLLFLEPVFKQMIWGGGRLKGLYPQAPSEKTGECWGVSAHENGDGIIRGGRLAGQSLSRVYREHRELFGGYPGGQFPLLIKLIDAREDLSIQVHPDDEYAAHYRPGSLGKTECWLVLDAEEGADIVIGHHARTKEELEAMISEGRWDAFIRKVPVKKGDFFQIDAGCLHAIRGGTFLIETQQSSDITFRVYDYDRLSDGKKRELHQKESIDCIRVPYENRHFPPKREKTSYGEHTHYIDSPYYSVNSHRIYRPFSYKNHKYFTCVSVLEGEGSVQGYSVRKGDFFIIPSDCRECLFFGDLELLFVTPV